MLTNKESTLWTALNLDSSVMRAVGLTRLTSGWLQTDMRILVLVTEAFGGIGGIAQFGRDFLRAMSQAPDVKEIVVLPRKIRNDESVPPKVDYRRQAARGKFAYFVNLVKVLKQNPKFNLIICGHFHLLPLAFFSRFFGAKGKIVLVIHGIEAWRPNKRFLLKELAPKIDALISVSHFTKNRFMEWSQTSGVPSYVLPNTVDFERYQPGPKNRVLLDRYNLEGKKILVTLARLSSHERYKGIDEVLNLLPELIKEIPNLVYIIAGEGSDRKRLEQRVETLGIRQHVIFTGFVPEGEKPDYYRLADAFVMPSRGEGSGIVYLEAMACGIPVVASTADASREALRHSKYAYFADPDSPSHVREVILECLNQTLDGAPLNNEYSLGNFTDRVHHLLNDLLPANPL